MKTTPQPKQPVQQHPKSVLDMTPYELSRIEAYQNRNRGFREYDEEELENFNWED